MADGSSHESGFSLIELLVAMAITLIVSGAIYGLLAGGQNAFRREPELTERQQNIRVAMDLIMRDIGNAGTGLPPFVQVFKEGLDACATCPMGPNNVRTDMLEIISNGGRDSEPVCADPGNSSQNIVLARGGVVIPPETVIVLTSTTGFWTTRTVTSTTTTSTGTGDCANGGGASHTRVNFNSGAGDPTGLNVAGGPCQPAGVAGFGNMPNVNCSISSMSFSEIIRYRIALEADGVPALQRFSSSRWGDGYQTIARGIEDLQVQYTRADAPTVWLNGAPVVTPPSLASPQPPPDPNAYGTLTRQVRVTLAARSEAKKIQGARTALSGPAALRGSLTSTGSPRSALIHVVQGRPASPVPVPPWSWQ